MLAEALRHERPIDSLPYAVYHAPVYQADCELQEIPYTYASYNQGEPASRQTTDRPYRTCCRWKSAAVEDHESKEW